jgi:segregation and condensation protein A
MNGNRPSGVLSHENQVYQVRLAGFEGPLDLLLHLIRKNRFDIWDIPIARILQEYLEVLEVLRELNLDHAGEFLLMAATLAQIKSKLLLPVHEEAEEEGEDPRAGLVRRLLEYEQFRAAAGVLDALPVLGRDVFARTAEPLEAEPPPEQPLELDLYDLVRAFRDVLKQAPEQFADEVVRQRISLQDAIREILELCEGTPAGDSLSFRELFPPGTPRERLVAVFLALLELVRLRAIVVMQSVPFGEIRIRQIPMQEA